MKIIELLYKEGRVFFYAIDENTAFIFGTSKAEAPTMLSTESEGWSLIECQHVTFQALKYEIAREYTRHYFVCESDKLYSGEKELYIQMIIQKKR